MPDAVFREISLAGECLKCHISGVLGHLRTSWEVPMQRIGFIVLPGFQMMSVAVLSVFELANWESGGPVYDVHLLSETGGSIRSSIGISVATEPFDDTNFDTLMVGSSDVARAVARKLVVYHRRAGGQSQFSALLELEPKSDRIQSVLAYAKRNLD